MMMFLTISSLLIHFHSHASTITTATIVYEKAGKIKEKLELNSIKLIETYKKERKRFLLIKMIFLPFFHNLNSSCMISNRMMMRMMEEVKSSDMLVSRKESVNCKECLECNFQYPGFRKFNQKSSILEDPVDKNQ